MGKSRQMTDASYVLKKLDICQWRKLVSDKYAYDVIGMQFIFVDELVYIRVIKI